MAATPASGQDALGDLDRAIARLAEEVVPGVVLVESTAYAPALAQGDPGVVRQSTIGSGVILSADGYVLTNAHVVAGATQARIQLAGLEGPPGESVVRPRGRRLRAEVVGIDLETDLALLRTDTGGLPALELADSEQVRQGQLVLAFGSPFGLENSVSMGIVSSTARQLQPDDRMIYIQTDAPINPGNSGGPLVNLDGQVVGINTMSASGPGDHAGVGFAVPSNIVRSVVEQLRESGVFARAEIGVAAQTITPELAAGLALDRDQGVVLADVLVGGPAYGAGLRIGDVILALDGKPMENARQFLVNLYFRQPGSRVRLDIQRGGARLSRLVPVRVPTGPPEQIARFFQKRQQLVTRLGLLAVAVDDGVREYLPVLRMPGGLFVTNQPVFGGAARGLIGLGDILYSIDGQHIDSVEALESKLLEYDSGDSAVFQVERAGRLSFVVVDFD